MKVFFTPMARQDLKELRRHIASQSYPDRADDYIRRIVRYCDELSRFPLRGTAHDELLTGLRTVGFERRVTIAFVVTDTAIYIEGVFYAGRDWQNRLQS